ARLDRKAIAVRDRKPDHREVERIAGRPDHIGDASHAQIELGQDFLVESVAQSRQRLFRDSYTVRDDIDIDRLGELGVSPLGPTTTVMRDAGAGHKPPLYACKAAEQSDAVARELVQVNGMAAPGARDVRLADKLRLRRRQITHFAVVLAHPGEPPVRIL